MLRDILDELSRASGMTIVARDPLSEVVTIESAPQPIVELLDAVLKHRNYTLAYGGGDPVHPRTLFVHGPRRHMPINETAIVLALGGADMGIRLDAVVRGVLQLDDAAQLDVLRTALADADPRVRVEAVDAFAETGGERALPWLADALQDPSVDVREAAVDALGDIGGERALAALTGILSDTDPGIRESAIYAIHRIDGARAVESLRQALADPDAFIRDTAQELIAERVYR